MSLVEDLKTRFLDIDATIIDKYAPIYENRYKVYYNADYGINSEDDEIILNLLAHLIVTANNSATNGGDNIKQIASESVGVVSVSYATNANLNVNDNFFNSTIYGQTFLMLIKRNNGAYFV